LSNSYFHSKRAEAQPLNGKTQLKAAAPMTFYRAADVLLAG